VPIDRSSVCLATDSLVRVSAARRLLELGREAPKKVAVDCGFANAVTLRRAFIRHIGVTPAEYRKRYASD
jgi:transcriptional regulator GlxA family with amidase domain